MAVDLQKNQINDGMHLYELPEACITSVISMTTPKDAWRMAAVASWCGPLASSDQVWEKFLPPDYLDILNSSPDGQKLLDASVSKKDLYLRMCDNPLLKDEGTKSFALDKPSGKKTFMLSSKALAIVWSHTPAYWRFIPFAETRTRSRFTSVALLVMVCWLEIQGVINSKTLSQNTKYVAYMVFTMKEPSYGFSTPPGEVSVGFGGQECEKRAVVLGGARPPDAVEGSSASNVHIQKPEERSDGWLEIEMGEIFINGDDDDHKDVHMKLTETKGLNWKSGLVVEGIEIRPKRELN